MTFSADNESSPKGQAIVDHIYSSLVAQREKSPRRNYLGASMWGEKCERKLSFIYTKAPVPDEKKIKGPTYAIFDMGHDGEKRASEYLRIAGFTLLTERPDGSQFGFEAAKDKDGHALLSGHIDGVFIEGPKKLGDIDLTYPLMWENKALGEKSWKDVVKNGLKKSKPIYHVQIQTYCAYMDVPNGGIFTAINRNTGEIYAEVVQYDPIVAQEASDKALRIISAGDPFELSRHTNDPSHFECGWCAYKEICWNQNAQTPTVNTIPSWIK